MRVSTIEINGEKHLLCFNLWALSECIERFGSLSGMSEALTKGKSNENINAALWVLETLQRGGKLYSDAMGIDNAEPISAEKMLIVCGADFFVDLRSKVIGAVNSGMSTNVKVEGSKNVETTQTD